MSTPATDGPPAAPVSDSAEQRALRAAPAWAVLWLAAATAAVAWWRVAPLMDEALVATVFLAGAAWWLINAGSRHAHPPGPVQLVMATGGVLLALRLLQVVSPADFWILRAAPLLLLLAMAVLVGGAGSVRPGLPGWFALLLWLWWPAMVWLTGLDAHGGVSGFTAGMAGRLLSLAGYAVRVEGPFIFMNNIRVEVLVRCTCLPLVQALAKTLVPGALLLRLTWRRTFVLTMLVVPVAFVVSVVRCAWLVVVAPQPERFHFWHGDEGASVFTAAALAIIGWGMVAGARAPAWLARPVPRAAAPRAVRMALALMVVAAVFSWWGRPAVVSFSVPVAWTPPPGWSLVSHRQFAWTAENVGTDKPLTQVDEWVVGTPAGRARFLVGYAPELLGGDPAQLVYLQGFDPLGMPMVQGTTLPGMARPVATWPGGNGRWWVTFADPDGEACATPDSWIQWLHGQRWQPARWVRLLAGQGPLLDKRALWIAVSWPAADADRPVVPAAVARLMASGLDMAGALLSAGVRPSSPAP
jgi:exosortase/archaeosortase family protein